MKILMVCLGNICRSPLAEGILKDKVEKAALNWEVDSAATANYNLGDAPHHLSQKVAAMHGIDISGQRARQFRKEDMLLFDKIYVMDNANYFDVQRISGEFWVEEKVDYLLNEAHPGKDLDIPDPWGGTEKRFHEVFTMMEKACIKIILRYVRHPMTIDVMTNDPLTQMTISR
jgi:protein-tyrosine phosphatase